MDWGLKDDFVERMFRRSRSVHSRRYYSFGVQKLEAYCREKKLNVSQRNVYDVIDSFVGWLDGKGVKPKTIADYVSASRRFLVYAGINVEPALFKARVVMPKVTKIVDEPLRLEDVRLLLTRGRPNPKMRALILTLLSSGMRVGEALSIRGSDLDLEGDPATVSIQAQYAKSRVARVAYVSDEAKEALKILVAGRPKDRLVVEYSGDLWQREKVATRTFRELADRAGLGEMIENHRIHKVHFHSFRKFFLTKAVDTLGDHAGHALCGHGFYMDTYYKKSEEERRSDYRRLMPHLTVFGETGKGDIRSELVRQLLLVSGFKPQEVDAFKASEMSDEEVQQKVKERLLGGLTNNGNRQKVIPITEVRESISQGWEYVDQLSTGEAIVRLPS